MSDENGQAPPQPTFPQQQVQVTPQGVFIQVVLAPGTGFFTTIAETTMNDVMKLWVQTRKDIADQMRVIEQVKRSKE